ncbi:MAG: hypothetical protein INR71_15575, partial [Terriglobus roseus]|nr:hypothetical protein [Terriglobus roseus]
QSSSSSMDMSPYSALLLLRGATSLVKEVEAEAGKEVAATVNFFIRSAGPTKSLQKLTKICRMSMRELQFLARHLIHWRRAIAIPPLNTTQTYVVSPTADFARLSEASAAFSRRFAALPSLPVILSYLGRTPREFGTIIPTKDHKAMYLEILAWLIREGWVMQLRTFAWIRVSARVKAKVHKIVEDERLAETDKEDDDEAEESAAEDNSHDAATRFSLGRRRVSGGTADSKRTSLLSPRLMPHLRPPRPASDAGSIGSARTAVPISTAAPDRSPPRSRAGTAFERGSQRTLSRQSSNLVTVVGNERASDAEVAEIDASDFEPSLILSPAKANALESRWIDQIGSMLVDEELRAAWPNLSKYFDGNCALGEIAMREGLKRKSVNAWLNQLVEQDILMTVRHW